MPALIPLGAKRAGSAELVTFFAGLLLVIGCNGPAPSTGQPAAASEFLGIALAAPETASLVLPEEPEPSPSTEAPSVTIPSDRPGHGSTDTPVPVASPSADAPAIDTSRPLPVREEIPDDTLQQELVALVEDLRGTYGIAAYSFATGRTVRLNDDRFFPSASLYKLIVLYEAYAQDRRGRLALDDVITLRPEHFREEESTELAPGDRLTVAEALHLMSSVSSTATAHALLGELGWTSFNEAASDLGLDKNRMPVGDYRRSLTGWRSRMASTSPRDMLRFFQLLGQRRLIDGAASEEMLDVLLDQAIQDRIPAGLPPDEVAVAHKTGNLAAEGVYNDAGIVFTPRGGYVLVVITMDADVQEAFAVIPELAARVHARYG